MSKEAATSNIPHQGARAESDFHRNISSEDDDTRRGPVNVPKLQSPRTVAGGLLHVPTERGDGPLYGGTSQYKSPASSH